VNFIVFDIETGPLEMDRLKQIIRPFDRSSVSHPGEFDPSTVKCGGNIGGPDSEKGKAKIEEARLAHAKAVVDFKSNVDRAEQEYWSKVADRAALSALTGRILAIGYKSINTTVIDHIGSDRTERDLCESFWDRYRSARKQDRMMTGFNIKPFDVPFIAQRSIILGVEVPGTILQNGRWLDSVFVDLYERWGFGSKASGNLNEICHALGLPGKPDGVDGSMFAGLFLNPETFQEAIEYLEQDLSIEFDLAERLLI
jgi:hypothetical protein